MVWLLQAQLRLERAGGRPLSGAGPAVQNSQRWASHSHVFFSIFHNTSYLGRFWTGGRAWLRHALPPRGGPGRVRAALSTAGGHQTTETAEGRARLPGGPARTIGGLRSCGLAETTATGERISPRSFAAAGGAAQEWRAAGVAAGPRWHWAHGGSHLRPGL